MAILLKEVSHTYKGVRKKSGYAAIIDVNLKIDAKNEFIAICGKTGSGKSTMIQHMNALLTPTKGEVQIFDNIVSSNPKKNKKLSKIRKRVGLVFQFPEYQLFEETVIKDIMFAPLNFGSSYDEAKKKALKAAEMVGLDNQLLEKSPFRLSGGQMRRVAIAGILAMEPEILVLDEPTRGLDPQGKVETMELFLDIHKKYKKTIILITHDMDIVGEYAKRVIVMKDGKKVFDGDKNDLFVDPNFDSFHLDLPMPMKFAKEINNSMNLNIDTNVFTLEELLNKLR